MTADTLLSLKISPWFPKGKQSSAFKIFDFNSLHGHSLPYEAIYFIEVSSIRSISYNHGKPKAYNQALVYLKKILSLRVVSFVLKGWYLFYAKPSFAYFLRSVGF